MGNPITAFRDRSPAAAMLLLSSLAAACGGSPETPVDAGPAAFAEVAMAEGELVFVAGHEESRPGHVLHRPGRVLRVAPDTFVVVHRGDNEILVFSSDGTLQRTLGGQGAGPAEFTALEDAWSFAGDSIVAWDPALQRLSYWSPGGVLSRSVRVEHEGQPSIAGIFADGSAAMVAVPSHPRLQPGESWYGEADVYVLSPEGTPGDVIAVLPWVVVHAVPSPVGPGSLHTRGFFDPTALLAVHDSVLFFSWGSEVPLRVISRSGTVLWNESGAGAVRPVTPAMVEQWRAERVGAADASQQAALRGVVEALPVPEFVPAHDMLFVADDGRLWARQFPDPGSHTAIWRVYGSGGGVAGSAMLPSAFRPHWADDDEIVGVLTGLHDVEAVVRLRSFRLEPAGGR
jgi:hypothetical protein